MSSKLWILLVTFLAFQLSCKEPAKASKKSPGSENANPGPVTTQSERPQTSSKDDHDDECENHSDDEHEDEDDDDLGLRLTGKSIPTKLTGDETKKKSGKKKNSKKKLVKAPKSPVRGFGLLAADPNYDDDIKSILSDKCESCHNGTDDYALDTFAKAKKIETKIAEQVASGDMPPKNKSPLTSSEKSTIKKWVDAGTPEEAVTEDDEEEEDDDDDDDDSDKNKKKDDCDDDHDEGDDEDDKKDKPGTAADWEDLLKSKEVEKCKDKDKIFDRLKEICHKAKVASFECNKSGVLKAFKDLSINVESSYDDFIGHGYKIDQCGEYNKEPVVLFYKKKEENNELKLLIKKLCKKGSEACDN